jgi:CubicO group peptidase (beta-lactamase class C family)
MNGRRILELAAVCVVILGTYPQTSTAQDTERVAVCYIPPAAPALRRTLSVTQNAARFLEFLRLARRGECASEVLPDAFAAARVRAGEEAEEITQLLLRDRLPPLPIDDVTSIPPDAVVMGRCIEDQYAAQPEVGFAYAIATNGALARSGAGGWARAPWETSSPNVPMTATKPMTIASVSKPVTAVAVMNLIEDTPGLDLDDPFYPLIQGKFNGPYVFSDGIQGAIPGSGVDQVTIRQLLMHRSGLKPGLGCGFGNLAKLLATGVVGTPGVTYDYENSNFCLLREVVEQVSAGSYIDYVQTNVLAPMGVVGMSCEKEDVDPTLYYNTLGDAGYLWDDFTSSCSAYGWSASAAQLAAFQVGVRNNAAIGPASTDEMQTGSCGSNGYCLGWIRSDSSIGVHSWHNGDWIDGDPCDTQGSIDEFAALPESECKRGYNGTIMRFQLGVDGVLLVNTRGGTGVNPGLKSEVTILRECFAQAFLEANADGGR